MKRVGVLPTLVTAANGYCGLLAIYKTHDGQFAQAGFLILAAMVFDVLDGLVARLARVTSKFGAFLDSLSDAVSFGVAPAFLVKVVVERDSPWAYPPKLLAFLTIPFALCALLRLARYNVEHASAEGSDRKGKGVSWFDGIPTPGAAGLLAAAVVLVYDRHALLDYTGVLVALPPLALVLGGLMVSRVPYIHFGKRFLAGGRDFGYLFFVLIVVGLLVKFPEEFAACGFLAYGLSGPLLAPFRRRTADTEELDDVEIPEGL